MSNWLERAELLLGSEQLEVLNQSHVMVIGLGGVGGFAAESICRAGVGKMTIVDGDTVDLSNKNRQLIALDSTEGQNKAHALANRLKDINPDLKINIVDEYLDITNMRDLLNREYDFLIEAIDTVAPKFHVIKQSYENRRPFVSAMGAGGKLDPTKIEIADISKTYGCKLAKNIRKKLSKARIKKGVTVVYSPEIIDIEKVYVKEGMRNKKSVIGTISYLPPLFGGYCASVAIRTLIGEI
ncbi:MAG: tRNA threonylcarbamoyladenosine dehydratase [Candidatus Cloacimonetes bacterium]|nr:tRNA threonylcarbamoyladenosine dehydratase [Candidatus Cloacimonadota bacterium]